MNLKNIPALLSMIFIIFLKILLSVSFINNFQFLSSSLDSLVKNLSEDDSKYLSREFHNKASDLVKQKGFYSI